MGGELEKIKTVDTAELEFLISCSSEVNSKVASNEMYENARKDADECSKQYDALTAEIEIVRKKKEACLDVSRLGIDGLTFEDGEFAMNGQRWDNMSGAEQLIFATSICNSLSPGSSFVLIDKLEQMDIDTLQEFGDWLKKNELQAIGTRVSEGDECSFVIEDGEVVNE